MNNEQPETNPNEHLSRADRGFTLIGIIIALAIAGILAAAIIPRTMNSALDEIRRAEDQNLAAIKANIRAYVQSNRRIPGAATWAADIGTYAELSPAKLTQNGMNGPRIYVYPSDFIAAGNTLLYDQYANALAGTWLTQAPANPRIMIISNLDPQKPLTLTASGPIPATSFNAIWDQAQGAGVTEGKDVHIERVNLADLFIPVTINNNDLANPANFAADGAPGNVPAQTSVTYHFLRGTQLALQDQALTVVSRETINTATSYVFANNVWGSTLGGVGGGAGGGGAGGGGSANQFLTATQQNGQTVYTANWAPQQGCTSAGVFPLTITNNNVNGVKYNIYASDPANLNGSIYLGNVKAGKTKTFNVAGCSLVLGAPENNGNASLLLFYMPNAAYSVTVN